MKISIKKLLALIAVAAVIIAAFIFLPLRRGEEAPEIISVERGAIYREVFAAGKVRPARELNLAFRSGGLIAEIFAKEGDLVSQGQSLARLDTTELLSRLRHAEIAISAQERAIEANHAQIQNAKSQLSVVINNSYVVMEDIVVTRLQPFFTLIGEFGVTIISGATTHFFNTNDFELQRWLRHERASLVDGVREWNRNPNLADAELLKETELALQRLERVRAFLGRLAVGVSYFSTEQLGLLMTIDAYRGMVSTMRGSIENSILALESARQTLRAAQSNLNPALIEKARASAEMLRSQLDDSLLVAPSRGKVFKRHAEVGEVSQPGEVIFTIHPVEVLRIEAEIYEGDIDAISVGEKAELRFVAFPDRILSGRVIAIERAPILIDGVVHFHVILNVIEPPRTILPGMSLDVIFNIRERADVLVLPITATWHRDNAVFVTVLTQEGLREEREVKLGARGDNRMVEISEGLREGDQVLLQ